MNDADCAAQKTADRIFDDLGTYERGQLATWGTSFTTYEDHGAEVCRWLEARARSWRVAEMTRAGA